MKEIRYDKDWEIIVDADFILDTEAIEKANKRKKKHKIRYAKIVEYPIKQICSFIRDYNVVVIDGKYYTTEYNDLIPFIEERFQVTLDRKILTEKKYKKYF